MSKMEPPNAESDAGEKTLAFLEAQADIWAEEVNLPKMVRTLAAADNRIPQIDAMIRLAFVEGGYRGYLAVNAIMDARDETNPLASHEPATPIPGRETHKPRKEGSKCQDQ